MTALTGHTAAIKVGSGPVTSRRETTVRNLAKPSILKVFRCRPRHDIGGQELAAHIEKPRKGKRDKPLTEQAKGSNRTKFSVWVRVEHIFGAQVDDMAGTLVRTIGMMCAKTNIWMKNLAYNMRRLGQLCRLNLCPV